MLLESSSLTQHPDDHSSEHEIDFTATAYECVPKGAELYCRRCGLAGTDNLKRLSCSRIIYEYQPKEQLIAQKTYRVVKNNYQGHFLAVNSHNSLECLRCLIVSVGCQLTPFACQCTESAGDLKVDHSQLKDYTDNTFSSPLELSDPRTFREHHLDSVTNIPSWEKRGG